MSAKRTSSQSNSARNSTLSEEKSQVKPSNTRLKLSNITIEENFDQNGTSITNSGLTEETERQADTLATFTSEFFKRLEENDLALAGIRIWGSNVLELLTSIDLNLNKLTGGVSISDVIGSIWDEIKDADDKDFKTKPALRKLNNVVNSLYHISMNLEGITKALGVNKSDDAKETETNNKYSLSLLRTLKTLAVATGQIAYQMQTQDPTKRLKAPVNDNGGNGNKSRAKIPPKQHKRLSKAPSINFRGGKRNDASADNK